MASPVGGGGLAASGEQGRRSHAVSLGRAQVHPCRTHEPAAARKMRAPGSISQTATAHTRSWQPVSPGSSASHAPPDTLWEAAFPVTYLRNMSPSRAAPHGPAPGASWVSSESAEGTSGPRTRGGHSAWSTVAPPRSEDHPWPQRGRKRAQGPSLLPPLSSDKPTVPGLGHPGSQLRP